MLKKVVCPECGTEYWTPGQTEKCLWCGCDIFKGKVQRIYSVHVEIQAKQSRKRVCESPFCHNVFESHDGRKCCSAKCKSDRAKYLMEMRRKMKKYSRKARELEV